MLPRTRERLPRLAGVFRWRRCGPVTERMTTMDNKNDNRCIQAT